jgi:hypothetical protein
MLDLMHLAAPEGYDQLPSIAPGWSLPEPLTIALSSRLDPAAQRFAFPTSLQSGSSTRTIRPVSIAETGKSPIVG